MALNYSIAYLIKTNNLSIEDYINKTADFVRETNLELSEKIRNIPKKQDISEIGTSGYALEALPAAIYCFIKSPDNFEKSLITAVNAGGDTDSIAAITGAISGVYNGKEAIPKKWIK